MGRSTKHYEQVLKETEKKINGNLNVLCKVAHCFATNYYYGDSLCCILCLWIDWNVFFVSLGIFFIVTNRKKCKFYFSFEETIAETVIILGKSFTEEPFGKIQV